VTSDGFEAHWQIAAYETSHFVDASSFVETAPDTPSIGVSLLEAVPIYRMIHRAAKYAPLLVALSFATYFFFEILSGLRIHPVQYGLLGLSLSLFALLLLSIGEIVGYTAGFIASAGLVLIQASAYTAAIARRPGPALVFAAMLATLFAFIYVLLSLETYSLLVGALALFIVLSVLMSLVQKMSWLAEDEPRRASA
jgi:inner membrane protein